MGLDINNQVTEFSADQIATLREVLDRVDRDSTGIAYGDSVPTKLEPGKIYLMDDGTTQTGYLKTAEGTIMPFGGSGNIPAGGIILWSGTIATVPTGWVLCDGSNSTPDLTNRFIVGADADDSGTAKSTVTGAALQTSDGVIPAHSHSLAGKELTTNGTNLTTHVSSGKTDPGTNIDVSSAMSDYGTGTKVIATFYALAYIMKT